MKDDARKAEDDGRAIRRKQPGLAGLAIISGQEDKFR